MKPEFWLERWKQGQIGFHEQEVHAALPEHWKNLRVPAAGIVFVPLCGKSRDMLWLRAQGHPVLGVELSPIAVRDFFAENGMKPSVSHEGQLERHAAEGVTLLSGDFFDVTPQQLRGVAGVYDRAALIALPPDVRRRYVERMGEWLPAGSKVLLVSLSYPPGEMAGPPFSVDEAEVRHLYDENFQVEILSTSDALAENPHLRARGVTKLDEQVYGLTRRGSD